MNHPLQLYNTNPGFYTQHISRYIPEVHFKLLTTYLVLNPKRKSNPHQLSMRIFTPSTMPMKDCTSMRRNRQKNMKPKQAGRLWLLRGHLMGQNDVYCEFVDTFKTTDCSLFDTPWDNRGADNCREGTLCEAWLVMADCEADDACTT